VAGIRVAMKQFPNVPQVAVFDTAFHQTLPPYAYLYGLPYDLYKQDTASAATASTARRTATSR
jgi:acetate kinase